MKKKLEKPVPIKDAIADAFYELESRMDSCGVEDGATFGRWTVDLEKKIIFCEETAWDFSFANVETS